jgi:hypothetical protein
MRAQGMELASHYDALRDYAIALQFATILDEVGKRCFHFLHCCSNSEFDLVRFAALHGAKFSRSLLPTY